MKEMKIVTAIVIYNKKISESISCKRIEEIKNDQIEILVIDNSEYDLGNREYCEQKNYNYISMNGNSGLSKAYNAAIEKSKNKDIIVLLDDDTEITEEYFNELIIQGNLKEDVDIFVPIIYGQDGVIYSPNEYGFLRNHFIKSGNQEIRQELFNAIASCMAIRMRVFNDYQFNEELFVDQVDQNFCYDQRKLGRKFDKLNVKIVQNFYQRGENLSPEAGWKRLKLRITDIMRQTELIGGKKIKFWGFIKCCGLGVQIGEKSRSLGVCIKAIALAIKLFFS